MWKANVSSANLTLLGEIARLKDNGPAQAFKLLFCQMNLGSVWELLTSCMIVTNKLKNQLKKVRLNGREDHGIINLAIDIKTIENRR